MALYQKVIYQLVEKELANNSMEEYNGYYSIINTITDDKQIQEYVNARKDATFYCGAYFSSSHGIFAIGYKWFMEIPDPQ